MSKALLALCLLGLFVATAMALPRGRRDQTGKGNGGPLVCEVARKDMTRTTPCRAGYCSLGPLKFYDGEGQLQMTMKFCDGLDEDGTSRVAGAACLITSLSGDILVNRGSDDGRRPPCDSELELAIKFNHTDALAYFTNIYRVGPWVGRQEKESEGDQRRDCEEKGEDDDCRKGSDKKDVEGDHSEGSQEKGDGDHWVGTEEKVEDPGKGSRVPEEEPKQSAVPVGNDDNGIMKGVGLEMIHTNIEKDD